MFKTQKLSNGIELITAPIKGTETVTILVLFGTGSKFEDKKTSGLSHFIEHMIFKGTLKRPNALAIAGELDKMGGEYNAFTSKETTGYWVKVQASQFAPALEVLSDIILNSKFASQEIDLEKGVIIEELNMQLDNPLIYLDHLFEKCLYGDTPAGWEVLGSKENIVKFTRDDFINYIKSQYTAVNAVICLAGRINNQAPSLIKKYFAKMPARLPKEKEKVDDRQTRAQVKLFNKPTDQAHLSVGGRSYYFGHPDEIILKVMAVLLGGTMSSRLFIELRERQGLAYYVRTQSELYTDSGYLATSVGVRLDKVAAAIKIILTEYKKLTDELVLAKELNKVKNCLIGRTALQLETSDDLANWYAQQAILFKEQGLETRQGMSQRILSPEQYYKKVKQVAAIDIRRVAREIFVNNKLNLAIIGPSENEKEMEKMLHL